MPVLYANWPGKIAMISPTFTKALNKMSKKRKKAQIAPWELPVCEPLQQTRPPTIQEHVTKYHKSMDNSAEFCVWCDDELLPHANPNGPDFSQDCGCEFRKLYNQSRRTITALLDLAALNIGVMERRRFRDSCKEDAEAAEEELHNHHEYIGPRHDRLTAIVNEHRFAKSRSK